MKTNSTNKNESFWGMVFISPWVIGLFAFSLIPMIASFIFTFYSINPTNIAATHFVGFENWSRMLFHDADVPKAIAKTLLFSAVNLPLCLTFSFFLAVVLNSKNLLGTKLFQTLFYLPTMIPAVATIFIWKGVLNEQTGWIDIFIEKFLRLLDPSGSAHATGAEGIRWLSNPKLIYMSYTMMDFWGMGNYIMIFLAGLHQVPVSLYEAAHIEGAGWWTRLFKITIPQISPIILYNLVIYLIAVLQYMVPPLVMNHGDGSPAGMTNFITVYFYRQGFNFFNMGYGATLAWLIFAIASTLVFLAFKISKKYVYYAGEK